MLLILTYGVEVWGVKPRLGEAAEVIRRSATCVQCQCNVVFFTNVTLQTLLTESSSSMLSNTAATPNHVALLCTEQPEYKYAEYLSSVEWFSRLPSRLDVDATVCMLTQSNEWTPKGWTCCVRYASHLRMQRTSTISCLIAQLIVTETSMTLVFGRPLLFQTS